MGKSPEEDIALLRQVIVELSGRVSALAAQLELVRTVRPADRDVGATLARAARLAALRGTSADGTRQAGED